MSRRTLVLAGHSLRRIRSVLIGVGVLLAAFQFLLTEVAAYLTRQGAFGQLADLIPDFVRTAIGPETLAFTSFTGIVSIGYFHPIVITSLVGLMVAIATEPVSEIEMRFVDLALARPLHRREIVTRTLLVLGVAGTLMLASMVVGTWSGLSCCAPAEVERPSFTLIVSLAFSLATLMACWAGVSLAIGMMTRRRAVAAAAAGVLALGTYLLDYLGRAWAPAATISRLSPFHYFEPMALVMGQPPDTWNVVILIGSGIVGVTISYVMVGRRDV